MVRLVGIHHLALVTGSLDLTLRFWRDLVGLQVRSRLGSPGYRQYVLAAGGQTLLSFFEWSGAEPVPEKDHGVPQRRPIAFDHVAFELRGDVELFQLRDRLADAGFWVSEVTARAPCVRCTPSTPTECPLNSRLWSRRRTCAR